MISLFQQSTSLSSVAIFQHHRRMQFTFHSSCVILQLVPSDFLDRSQLLTETPLKQGYVAHGMKSSLHTLYDCHHNQVDRYEISISRTIMDLLLFMYIFLSSITVNTFTRLDCIYEQYDGCLIKSMNCLHFANTGVPLRSLVGSVLLIFFFSFLCYILFFVCLRPVYQMLSACLDCRFVNSPSAVSNVYSVKNMRLCYCLW